ncbi:hypothetical protein FNH13_14455 [Ornithinimicrobium ciconiae]|uniref:Uncharacterized protein n=1 Tax=Ornithinimicrobium ciconiae TaxID=2594265 RepID=A0A516GCY7_9MICO|nr:hypothetical protein [Ornithinimicrobium ciconiae]QDO89383.1 hypothetical protein FNH13_14455 [Ornithinimicrobium ciconiae]
MNTISDLRRSLEQTAHHHDAPDPGELLRGVQDNIAAERGAGGRTSRLVAAAAAVALVAGGGWALSQGLGSEEETSVIQPAGPWQLVDGAPPEYAEGLALVETVTLSADYGVMSFMEADGQNFAVAWCDVAPEVASELRMPLGNPAGEGPTLTCAGVERNSPTEPVAVPPPMTEGGLGAHLIGPDGAQPSNLARGDTVVIGLYREASTSEYPYPGQSDIPEAPSHDVVLDPTSPRTNQAELAELTQEGVMLPAVRAESRVGTTLTTWAGEPGRLLVAVNGTVITNDGEQLTQPTAAGPWQDADPDLRGGYWHTWTAGTSTREFDLSPTGLAAHGIQIAEGEAVEIVAFGAFPRDAWQVGIDLPEGSEIADVREIGPTEQLPEYAYGLRLVSASEVPADGATHLIELDAVDPSQVLWVPACTERLPGIEVTIGTRVTQCHDTGGWVLAVQAPELASDAPVEVRVSAGSSPMHLGAYLPQDWEGYPFTESGTPLTGDGGFGVVLGEQPVDGARPADLLHSTMPTAVYHEVATVSSDDLDSTGRGEVTVPSSTDLSIWVATSGPARVKLEIDGVPVEQALDGRLWPAYPLLRDGWLSGWTTGDFGTELRFDRAPAGHADRDNPTVTVQVEAQEGAEVDLTFYEFVIEE